MHRSRFPSEVPRAVALAGALSAALVLAVCRGEATAPAPTVDFVIDAPLCSSIIPVELSIDNIQVGVDTFVTMGTRRTRSRAFTTTVGAHTVGARTPWGYVWPPRSVILKAGQAFTDSLPFYCS